MVQNGKRLLRTRIRVKGNSLPLPGSSRAGGYVPEPTWHWPDVIWQASLTAGSIRENSRFHGEYLASTGPRITRRYPLSFFRFSSHRNCAGPAGHSANRAPQVGAHFPFGDSAGAQGPGAALVTVAPPGSALYVAKRGDSIPLVARHYLSQTSYLTSSELSEAIHERQRGFPRHFPEGGPAGDHPRTAAGPDRREISSGRA